MASEPKNPAPPSPMRFALNSAAGGPPHPDVVDAVAGYLRREHDSVDLARRLSVQVAWGLGLPPPLTYRHNATSAIRDFVQTIAFHCLDKKNHAGSSGAPGRLLCTDVQQAAVREVLRTCWPGGHALSVVPLADLVVGGDRDPSDAIAARYVNALSSQPATVCVIPHVVWFNGAVLDVGRIARTLRRHEPSIYIIVDGAQAVGNIDTSPLLEDLEAIDAYVGCFHKWLGGPETLGFARVSQRMMRQCHRCAEILSSGDVLGEVGAFADRAQGAQFGTHRLAIAGGVSAAFDLIAREHRGVVPMLERNRASAERLRAEFQQTTGAISLCPPTALRSSIVAIRTTGEVSDIRRDLNERGYFPALYSLEPALVGSNPEARFLRFSPGCELPAYAAADIASIVEQHAPRGVRHGS